MAAFLSLLLRLSLLGSLLAGIVRLAQVLLRGRISQKVCYYLWLPVLLRFCLPIGITLNLPFSLPNAPSTVRTPAAVNPVEASQSPQLPLPAEQDAAPPEPLLRENHSYNLKDSLRSPGLWVSVWGMGTALCLGWYIGGYLRFSRRVRKSFRGDPEALALLRTLDTSGRVGLARSPMVHSPVLIGVLRPVVVLPEQAMDPGQLRDILLHELTHARRLDLPCKWIAAMAASIHWFNPLMPFLRREIGRACELSCDEAVIRGMDGPQRRHYGKTLLALSSGASSGPERLAVGLWEEKRHLKERLTAIAAYKKAGPGTAALSLVLAAAVCGCSLIAGTETAPSGVDTAEALRSALAGEREILCYTGESPQRVHIDDVPGTFSPDSPYATLWQFCAADLDSDGQTEAIVQFIDAAGDMGGYLLLHWENGKVLGYLRNYREFESLKTDGTYGFQIPAGTVWGICSGRFSGGEYETEPLYQAQMGEDGEISYRAGEEAITEEEYLIEMARQARKPDAIWNEFNEENIRRTFSGDIPQFTEDEGTALEDYILGQLA